MKKSKQERVMKQYLKMADVIDGFVLTSGVRCVTIGGYEQQSSALILAVDSKTADYTAHAINSHDELVQMNQELLAALESVIEWYDMEADHSIEPDFYKRMAACQASEDMAREAIAKAKGGAS